MGGDDGGEDVQFPGTVTELGTGLADMKMADLTSNRTISLQSASFCYKSMREGKIRCGFYRKNGNSLGQGSKFGVV